MRAVIAKVNFIIQTKKTLLVGTHTHGVTWCETAYQQKINTNISYKEFSREKNEHIICRPRSVHIGKNCALGLEHDIYYIKHILKTLGTVFSNTVLLGGK